MPNTPKIKPPNFKNVKNKIPFLGIPDTPLVATTTDHLPIADVTEDIVVFKDGGAGVVIESSSLNFGLLSEREQQAVIAAYAALINSLSFPAQIIVHSERKDIRNYMNYLAVFQEKIKNEKLLSLMESYKKFILETVKKKNVLGKRFFVVIPFSPLELGAAKSAISLTRRSGPLPYPKSYVIKKAKIALYPKRDHLIRQGRRLGIVFRQLGTEELINLYYHIYNIQRPGVKETDQYQ